MKKYAVLTLTILALLALTLLPAAAQDDARTPAELCAAATPAETGPRGPFSEAEDVLEAGVDYLAVFCTSAGPVLVDLFEDIAPITVNNFIFLSDNGYYNNTNFHRVIPDFMAQGGDPTNTGSGGPGYQFEDEIVEGVEFDRPGLLAMANAGPGTNGSQFFITTVPTDWLNGNHTIFGEVLAGQPNVENIQLRDPQQSFGPGTMLETVVILEGPDSVIVEEETFVPVERADVEAAWDLLDTTANNVFSRYAVTFGGPELVDLFALDTDATAVTDEAVLPGAEYRAAASLVNTDCALEDFPVHSINYAIDVYSDEDAAQAAFEDEALIAAQEQEDFTLVETELDGLVFTKTFSACEQDDLVLAREIIPRGRYLTTLEVAITGDNAEIAIFLPEAFAGQLFEDALHAIVRPETVEAATE